MMRGMKTYTILLVCLLVMCGCVQPGQYRVKSDEILDPIIVFRSFSSYYILSCLKDTQDMEREAFEAGFGRAEAGLEHGSDLDALRFVCLSLNPNADYKKFQQGVKVYEQYLEEHPDSGIDMEGLHLLLGRLDEEIKNKWSAWRSLLEEKRELQERISSLQGSLEQAELKNTELQNQIDQLKDIENIIRRRETDKP